MSYLDDLLRHGREIYGDLNPAVEYVFFTQGNMDPMRTRGPLEDLNESSPVIIMPRELSINILNSLSHGQLP